MAVVEQCRVDTLFFLGHRFSDLLVNIQDDEAGDFQGLPFEVIMTVGVDILYHKALYLNFAEREIGFLETVPTGWKRRGQTVGLHFKAGLAFFEASLGPLKLNTLFDTGAGLSVLHARCLDSLQADLVPQGFEETLDPTGARASIPVYRHPSLEIEGHSVGEIRFLVMDLTDVERAIGAKVDLIFGLDAIASHNWIVDKLQAQLVRISTTS